MDEESNELVHIELLTTLWCVKEAWDAMSVEGITNFWNRCFSKSESDIPVRKVKRGLESNIERDLSQHGSWINLIRAYCPLNPIDEAEVIDEIIFGSPAAHVATMSGLQTAAKE